MARTPNRLGKETSPYLRQHADNPVDWYPWGEEALARARAENKPILLSIGYSACHWCHVMAHESFENEATARLMNEHFVCIKVDREERPDLDHLYMAAVEMFTGRGGWPLTMFLTPAGEPFYGGTYFPPDDRYGVPAFPRVLQAIARAYRETPEEVTKSVTQIMGVLRKTADAGAAAPLPDAGTVAHGAAELAHAYDPVHGGIGHAPKFPNASVFQLFLRHHRNSGDERFLEMVTHTLRRMGDGGIYDHLGGGFHRYSVDQQWLVPHFEKMLYDQALLVPLYLAAYQVTGDLEFATIARESLDYVAREMRSPDGGFYSSQDADSEGEEGRYYVWEAAQVREILGEEAAPIICRYWDISDRGNFEGKNILHRAVSLDRLAEEFGRDVGELRLLIGEARAKLSAVRWKRPKPGRDDKILTSWNALMISAFARSAELFGEEGDVRAAVDGVAFVRGNLQRGDRLFSTFQNGAARFNGYLDDYAFFVAALLDVFEMGQDRALLDQAVVLTDSMLRHFWDSHASAFFFTSDDHEDLLLRVKPTSDGSVPSGNSVAVLDLLRLHHYTERSTYLEHAEATLRALAPRLANQPFAYSNLLCTLDFHAQTPFEVVVVGTPGAPETDLLVDQVRHLYLPNRTLTLVDPLQPGPAPAAARGKGPVDGKPTVYVCRKMTCSPPVSNWLELGPLFRQ